MKSISFILVFVVLYLSVLPCTDNIVLDNELGVSSIIADLHQDHGDNCPDSDACSPFCVCSCCQTHMTVMPIYLSSSITRQNGNDQHVDYQEYYPRGIDIPIWRPPQNS